MSGHAQMKFDDEPERTHPWLRKRTDGANDFVLSARHDALLRRTLLATGLAGTALFALLLALSYLNPILIEQWARNAIAQEVRQRVTSRLENVSSPTLARAAESLIGKNRREIAARTALAEKIAPIIAEVTRRMADPGCQCRLAIARAIIESHVGTSQLEQANARLTRLVESKYRDVAQSLLHEIRVFSVANGVVFVLLGLIAGFWRRPALQLLAPAFVLIAAVTLTGKVYLFNQDWLQTIMFGNYVGIWYFPYLFLALAFLSDVVFLKAIVSRLMINLVSSFFAGLSC